MIVSNKLYERWLIDCVENRKWTWPRIALCLVHIALRDGTSRRELLDELKQDYRKAAAQKSESK
jgi:ABC-type dipeptide/oligopeptide/nickel transport system permease component